MKQIRKMWLWVLIIQFIIVGLTISLVFKARIANSQVKETLSPVVTIEENNFYKPTQRQIVWLYALEWCESKGVRTAVNPKDRDNTPSYYSFQFKPGTFKGYALKYKILKKEDLDTDQELMSALKNYDYQYAIVSQMLGDKTVNWRTQFPDCINRKIGMPPLQ